MSGNHTATAWDQGNACKSADKHSVSQAEVERVSFNEPLLVLPDFKHSNHEARYRTFGVANEKRLLHITFTLRAAGTLIRVISARDMHREKRTYYEQTPKKKPPEFKTEAEERAFWESHDSSDYIDWTQSKTALWS